MGGGGKRSTDIQTEGTVSSSFLEPVHESDSLFAFLEERHVIVGHLTCHEVRRGEEGRGWEREGVGGSRKEEGNGK